MRPTFSEIREKLAFLDRLDPARKIFASHKHQYRLNPPLGMDCVEHFESLAGCRLPDQYRSFVTEFADGGAGPVYGIFPLGRLLEPGRDLDSLTDLARPFPVPRCVEEMRELGYSAPGALPISEIGCGGMYWLIFSGTQRGFVWVQNPDADWGPELSDESHLWSNPATGIEGVLEAALKSPKELRLEFVDWYVKWLDESLKEVKSQKIQGPSLP
ncbi:MAG: SMI1/KNR4 family protein [Planctomycetes bacterium]|nr:SMI1/KNR4 family protein [Planctomycetota bacterium]